MKDGLWQVRRAGVCAGFVVQDDCIVRCAPILRRHFARWAPWARWVCR